jgi:ABC-type transport system involved in multi-copper enzyme maturation permease subunit
VILAAFLLVNGYIFSFIVNYLNSPGTAKGQALQYLFTNSFFWFYMLFFASLIPMRLFAEERKAGTLEVLLTSPVTETTVVLGKFLGALGFYLSLWFRRCTCDPAKSDASRSRAGHGVVPRSAIGGTFWRSACSRRR